MLQLPHHQLRKPVILIAFLVLSAAAYLPVAAQTGCDKSNNCPAAAGIAFVSAASAATSTSSGTSTSALSFSPSNGNEVFCGLVTGGSASAPGVKDNNNVSLSAGTTSGGAKNTAFYYQATGSPTSFTPSWTGTTNAIFDCVQYSGVNSVNATPANNTATATSTALSVSPTSTVTNDFMVAVCGLTTAKVWTTPKTGNERATGATNGSIAIIDNTSGGSSGSGVTEADTITISGVWGCSAVEFKP
jgi:hypothetical protein